MKRTCVRWELLKRKSIVSGGEDYSKDQGRMWNQLLLAAASGGCIARVELGGPALMPPFTDLFDDFFENASRSAGWIL
jgi:hypothetical protein